LHSTVQGPPAIASDSHVAGPYGDQRLQSGLNVRSGGVVRKVHRRLGTQGKGKVATRGRDRHGLLGVGGGQLARIGDHRRLRLAALGVLEAHRPRAAGAAAHRDVAAADNRLQGRLHVGRRCIAGNIPCHPAAQGEGERPALPATVAVCWASPQPSRTTSVPTVPLPVRKPG